MYSRLREPERPSVDLVPVEMQGGKKQLGRQTLKSRVENGGWQKPADANGPYLPRVKLASGLVRKGGAHLCRLCLAGVVGT